MKTPYGQECPFFYGDYYRGRNEEECRLIGKLPAPQNWTSDLCATCPVPVIKRANACENMELSITIKRRLGVFKRYNEVSAYCHKSHMNVKEPRIGCPVCHPLEIKIGN